jgi:ABC transporter with metal-binding/Fe-S-binding domain ATP-binding protein
MKTGVLFSGGKDSCLALHKFGIENVDCLLSMIPETIDSFMFHTPIFRLLEKQAEMLGLKLIIEKTKGVENKELSDLKRLIKKSKIDRLIIGGIKSNYQGERIKKICSELKIELIAPLWGYSEDRLWNELFNNEFKVIITKIASEGIDKEFIGKVIDKRLLEELKKKSKKYGFRMDFEGGDAETAVLFMPEFKKEIKIKYSVESEDRYRHFLKLRSIE